MTPRGGAVTLRKKEDALVEAILRWSRRIGIAIAGGVVLLAGLAMMFLPGPGLLTIVVGLGILSLEFECARSWLERAKAQLRRATDAVKARARARREV